MVLQLCRSAISEGTEDDALPTFELKANTSLCIGLGEINLAIHGIVEHHLLGFHTESDEGINVLTL